MVSKNTKTIQKLSMSTFFHSLSINLLVHGALWSKISRQSTGCWWITGQRWTPVIMVTWTPGSNSAGPQKNTLSFFSYPSNSGGSIWASMLQGHFCLIKHAFFQFLLGPFWLHKNLIPKKAVIGSRVFICGKFNVELFNWSRLFYLKPWWSCPIFWERNGSVPSSTLGVIFHGSFEDSLSLSSLNLRWFSRIFPS